MQYVADVAAEVRGVGSREWGAGKMLLRSVPHSLLPIPRSPGQTEYQGRT